MAAAGRAVLPFESAPPAHAIELGVPGVHELTLSASDADGSDNSDHADRGDALIRSLR